MDGAIDFEHIVPSPMLQFAPTGILGLLLAGLLAAFMGTFASTVNIVPVYLINDIYLKHINPNVSSKSLIWGGYTLANILKGYWWRLNGYRYFAGMLSGIICAIIAPSLHGFSPSIANDMFPPYCFPVILLISGRAALQCL